MIVVPPVAIGTSQLTSSTVPEAVAATYNAGTTYAEGDRVGLAPTDGEIQVVWQSVQNGNTGQALAEGAWWTKVGEVYPEYSSAVEYSDGEIVTDTPTHGLYRAKITSTNKPVTDATHWEYIGPTNRFAALNYERNTRSVQPRELTYVITPGQRISAIALIGLVGSEYEVTATSASAGGEVFSESGSLRFRNTLSWSDYFFGAFDTVESVLMRDVPLYSDIVVTVTIRQTTGNAEVGAIVMGREIKLGDTLTGAVSEALNYSQVTRDMDGNAILSRKRSIPQTAQTVVATEALAERCRRARRDLNGVPAVWAGLSDDADAYFNSLTILGIYKDWSINMAQRTQIVQSIKLEQI